MSSTVNIPTVDVIGTTTNSNAAAGEIGEYVSSTINSASEVALTTGVDANVTSIALSAGDWDVSGIVSFDAASGTTTALLKAGTSTVSATFVTFASGTLQAVRQQSSFPASIGSSVVLPVARFSLAAPATIYLLCSADFAVSTMGAFGTIAARRAR